MQACDIVDDDLPDHAARQGFGLHRGRKHHRHRFGRQMRLGCIGKAAQQIGLKGAVRRKTPGFSAVSWPCGAGKGVGLAGCGAKRL